MKKSCSKCKIDKELSYFSKSAKAKDKHQSQCKQCQYSSNRSWAKKNKEKLKEIQRKYRHKNIDLVRKKAREYRVKIKDHYNENRRKWRQENPHLVYIDDKRNQLKRQYGLTLDQFNDKVKEQDNTCAICFTQQEGVNRRTGLPRQLNVDHCHISGKVRGLLCSNCNRGIGLFKENEEFLLSAIKYIKRYKKENDK